MKVREVKYKTDEELEDELREQIMASKTNRAYDRPLTRAIAVELGRREHLKKKP